MPTIEALKRELTDGHLGRREFVRGVMALGISLTAAGAIADRADAATPKKGGHLRQAIPEGSNRDTLDPGRSYGNFTSNMGNQLRNGLTEIASSGELIGELAESWEATGDAKRWTFRLRKGVEFHDGKTLDADDVVANVNHHRDKENNSNAHGLMLQIEEVKADGADTVVFKLQSGNVDFPYIAGDYHLKICPSKDGVIDWRSGTGTGGYSLKRFEPGVILETTRNPNYWKAGRAHFDSIDTLYIEDAAARTDALRSGRIDVMGNVDLNTVHHLQRDANITVISTTGKVHPTLPMLTGTQPFDNNHVRLALKHAIDREQALNRVLKGYGVLGNDHPIGPGNKFLATEEEIPQRQYDPDRARFHLKQAGVETLSVKLHVSDLPFRGAVDTCLLYKEAARAAGIDIDVIVDPIDGYWDSVWQNKEKPWVVSYWGGRSTEDAMFSVVYASNSGWNESLWKHERFDNLLLEARVEFDVVRRRELYVEMQRIVSDEGPSVIPFFLANVDAISKKIGLPEVIGNTYNLDGAKNAERWWMA